jgi:ATP-dependent DNA ligase
MNRATILSRVHWVEQKLVAEITYLTWTADDLLRHTVYLGVREDGRESPARGPKSAALVIPMRL